MENKPNRNTWIDYLRSVITVLVVTHHSALAYTTWANFDKVAYIRSTHAVVDTKRWIGLDIFVNFNDVFFMSLMFLIGGLFLTKSIKKKGTVSFIKDRVYRLLIPFLILGTVFMLIAYFPAYYIAHNSINIVDYLKDFFVVQQWPVGPPWFLWVLFLFNLVFAICYTIGKTVKTRFGFVYLQNQPVLFCIVLFLLTWLLYVPVSYNIGASNWTGFYPFDFQLNRILLYFGYFLVGILIGNSDFNNGLLSVNSSIASSWLLWVLLAFIVFSGLTIIPKYLGEMVTSQTLTGLSSSMIYYSIYAASCTLSCIAFISTFRTKIETERTWWNSLSENAYLIYLTHFAFITWTQFFLLKFDVPAFFKFIITFIITIGLSWWTSKLLRKFSLINKYL